MKRVVMSGKVYPSLVQRLRIEVEEGRFRSESNGVEASLIIFFALRDTLWGRWLISRILSQNGTRTARKPRDGRLRSLGNKWH